MTAPIDLDGPPNCVECGAPMVVTEHGGEGDGGASLWSAACWAGLADDRHPEWVDLSERPTLRKQPGYAALVAEIERLRAERQAILDAGGDSLWAGGAKTLPEAVAGALRALNVALTRSAKEYDQSPAAKVRRDHPHVKVTDAGLVESAVRNAGRCGARMARWAAVKEVFGHGSGVPESLCRACGLGPDEMVGDDGEGEE